MNQIGLYIPPGIRTVTDAVLSAYQKVADWTYRPIELMGTIPAYFKQNPNQASAAFITANAVCFFSVFWLAQILEERVESAPRRLGTDERRFNQFLINGLVVGGSSLIFNLVLSKLFDYHLSIMKLIAIAIASIALKVIVNNLCCEYAPN